MAGPRALITALAVVVAPLAAAQSSASGADYAPARTLNVTDGASLVANVSSLQTAPAWVEVPPDLTLKPSSCQWPSTCSPVSGLQVSVSGVKNPSPYDAVAFVAPAEVRHVPR